ncbi:MAG: Slp family lipoprotein [Gammaproteobacteria bacterium]|nr:Slp family lipoprotein [Gammaproteobacteria bacterium]
MNTHFVKRLFSLAWFSPVWFALVLFFTACSSQIPTGIKHALTNAPTIDMVRAAPDDYLSQPVRWGGVILNTENKQSSSRLIIIAYPLSSNGRPLLNKASNGRFIASFDSFLEPHVYKRDSIITVSGKLTQTETINIGEFPYNYPLVDVQQHFLWPVEEPLNNLYPLWWYDPFYWPRHPPQRH